MYTLPNLSLRIHLKVIIFKLASQRASFFLLHSIFFLMGLVTMCGYLQPGPPVQTSAILCIGAFAVVNSDKCVHLCI